MLPEEEVVPPPAPPKLAMRLEIGNINIKDVQLADKTEIKNGVLYVNGAELKTLLEQDKRLGRVDIDIANPGDSTRIVRVSDVYQPRARTGERKGEFPFPAALGTGLGTDALGTGIGAGNGSLNVLKGTALVVSAAGAPAEARKAPPFPGKIIQVSGSGKVSDFAKTHNVVVVGYPAKGVNPKDYEVALRIAGLRAATYLGRAAEDLEPEEVEAYQLPSLTEITKGMEKLPKVAYLFMVEFGNIRPVKGWGANVGEAVLYGGDSDELLPLIVHPNEVLDGAVTMQAGGWETTYAFQNNPIIKELYRRHGKELCFVGTILAKDFPGPVKRQRAVSMAVREVVAILGADGIVITKYGGGAPQNFIAQIAVGCERAGVKTVLIPWNGCFVIFTQPEARAVVNTGHQNERVELEPVEKVVGFHHSITEPPLGKFPTTFMDLIGTMNQLGSQRNKCAPTPGDTLEVLPQRNVVMDKTGAGRAIDMILARIAGEPWESEVLFSEYPPLTAAPAVKDVSKAKIALIGVGGLWRKGTAKFPPVRCDRFAAYNIKGVSTLRSAEWGILHFGYQKDWILADPHRLMALPELRQLEREGRIGKINDTMYCFSGLGNRWGDMKKIGQGILTQLQAEGVDGVIMVST